MLHCITNLKANVILCIALFLTPSVGMLKTLFRHTLFSCIMVLCLYFKNLGQGRRQEDKW